MCPGQPSAMVQPIPSMTRRLLLSRFLFITAWLLVSGQAGWLWAVPTLPLESQQRFGASLPKLFEKMERRQSVHVAFVGDPLLLKDHEERQSMVKAFLRGLEESFYYTGGVYNVYDSAHLEEKRPKITYECRATDAQDPGVFQLMQYVTTLGLLNEPDLLVLCAGPGDSATNFELATLARAFDKLHTEIKSTGTEWVAVGPRAFSFDGDSLVLKLEARAQTVVLQRWAEENQIAFYDPNPELFPRAVLFHPDDSARTIWENFLRESIDWIQGQDREVGITGRRQQTVGKALFRVLTESPKPSRYRASATSGAGAEKLTVTLQRETEQKLGGLIVPSAAGQRGGRRFQPQPDQRQRPVSFQVGRPEGRGQTFRGEHPLSFIVIDDRRVSWIHATVPLGPVGLEWLDHAQHNNLGTVPVRARLFPFDGAPERLPYELVFGDQRSRGTLTFLNRSPAMIDWAVTLPDDINQRHHHETLIVRLGDDGEYGVVERRLDAIRQFPLGKSIPLQWVGSSGRAAPKNQDPLAVGPPEASLMVEASKTDLTIHVDLKNFELAVDERKNEAGDGKEESALRVDLMLDARSFEKRQTLGYAGMLFITAGPEDGPATVSPFARQAHFGNGYAKRPLVPGRVARLSTLPNGVRRLTVQMTRSYFYRHPWALGNRNSQLGLGLSLAMARPGGEEPYRYVLQETPRYPNNAEDLALVELAEQGSNRWCVKWDP